MITPLHETKGYQFFLGFTLLIGGIVVVPLMGRFLVAMAVQVNSWVFGSLYGWQESVIAIFRILVGGFSIIASAYGAILLALTASVSAGLIQSPWE